MIVLAPSQTSSQISERAFSEGEAQLQPVASSDRHVVENAPLVGARVVPVRPLTLSLVKATTIVEQLNLITSSMEKRNFNPRCFLDISIDGEEVGRIVLKLFKDKCPKATENFTKLCQGVCGLGLKTKKPLRYQGSIFHRVVKGFMIQGGDISNMDGTGGESIYGGTFADECMETLHDRPFLLSMANRGPNTNGSQFFITTAPAPHLDGKHTVFGQVISGEGVVRRIEAVPVQDKKTYRPLSTISISACGQLIPVKKKTKKNNNKKEEGEEKTRKIAKRKREKCKTQAISDKNDEITLENLMKLLDNEVQFIKRIALVGRELIRHNRQHMIEGSERLCHKSQKSPSESSDSETEISRWRKALQNGQRISGDDRESKNELRIRDISLSRSPSSHRNESLSRKNKKHKPSSPTTAVDAVPNYRSQASTSSSVDGAAANNPCTSKTSEVEYSKGLSSKVKTWRHQNDILNRPPNSDSSPSSAEESRSPNIQRKSDVTSMHESKRGLGDSSSSADLHTTNSNKRPTNGGSRTLLKNDKNGYVEEKDNSNSVLKDRYVVTLGLNDDPPLVLRQHRDRDFSEKQAVEIPHEIPQTKESTHPPNHKKKTKDPCSPAKVHSHDSPSARVGSQSVENSPRESHVSLSVSLGSSDGEYDDLLHPINKQVNHSPSRSGRSSRSRSRSPDKIQQANVPQVSSETSLRRSASPNETPERPHPTDTEGNKSPLRHSANENLDYCVSEKRPKSPSNSPLHGSLSQLVIRAQATSPLAIPMPSVNSEKHEQKQHEQKVLSVVPTDDSMTKMVVDKSELEHSSSTEAEEGETDSDEHNSLTASGWRSVTEVGKKNASNNAEGAQARSAPGSSSSLQAAENDRAKSTAVGEHKPVDEVTHSPLPPASDEGKIPTATSTTQPTVRLPGPDIIISRGPDQKLTVKTKKPIRPRTSSFSSSSADSSSTYSSSRSSSSGHRSRSVSRRTTTSPSNGLRAGRSHSKTHHRRKGSYYDRYSPIRRSRYSRSRSRSASTYRSASSSTYCSGCDHDRSRSRLHSRRRSRNSRSPSIRHRHTRRKAHKRSKHRRRSYTSRSRSSSRSYSSSVRSR
ncbi:unnamed protein product [Calicophoron daubneyi]|uniref:peptidylprolyl isomerase n=1 Tax=Calicophoron daubneyi TaxID=300641 RepID=A0AAV2TDD9_CALDB